MCQHLQRCQRAADQNQQQDTLRDSQARVEDRLDKAEVKDLTKGLADLFDGLTPVVKWYLRGTWLEACPLASGLVCKGKWTASTGVTMWEG
ncbi:hypothetical protein BaRGS_00008500 [Batillaria attramentaria]|uniref:Uncharacterized protein n=1 Tax=Batillaria attramentaria TaxID=370345 RepID=A0ABD0LMK9_9CAEN